MIHSTYRLIVKLQIFMKKQLESLLKYFALKTLEKYQPKIIGITGSIGKTSTRDAIEVVLREHFRVRASAKNFNNEIGVPLTILGEKSSPGHSLLGWFGLFFRAAQLVFGARQASYPDILILEMGVDHPGDMNYLLSIAQPDIGVLTNVGASHLEFFKTPKALLREKKLIVTRLPKTGRAIMNVDNEAIAGIVDSIKAPTLTYGFAESADVRALELERSTGHGQDGLRFKLVYEGSAVPIYLPGALGDNALAASLAAATVGIELNMNLIDIAERLRQYQSPRGRMRAIEGIKNTLLIDDSYNAAPESTQSALQVLARLERRGEGRKIAVLGEMLELGPMSESSHEELGQLVAELGIDLLLTIGPLGQVTATAAHEAGMTEDQVFAFADAAAAGRFLQERMHEQDVILVKGSQGSRTEKVVKEVMAHPEQAADQLVRQGRGWS